MSIVSSPLLALEDLTVQIRTGHGMVQPVDRVSLTVRRGETLALVGESGCGKSMLCRALMGILPDGARMTAGTRIFFDGRELGTLTEGERNRLRGREIGMVLQNPLSALNPVQPIGRQIMEPMQYHLRISPQAAKLRALELLEQVGLPRPEIRFSSYPHQLSGGMRQRVAIAIAIACEPKLLIADEPTTALDVTVQSEVLNLLGRLQQERHMAMILVSHDLAVVAGRSHETAVMYAGRIVEKAPTRHLFRNMRMPYTRALFDAIPRIDRPSHTTLAAISGQPPDLSVVKHGCPFALRCPLVQERCREEAPLLLSDPDHSYACWFPLHGRCDERK